RGRGGRRQDRPAGRRDVLGRLLRGLHRPRRPSVGSRPQPALDAAGGWLGRASARVIDDRRIVWVHAPTILQWATAASPVGRSYAPPSSAALETLVPRQAG